MAIPNFQAFMLPVLMLLGENQELSHNEICSRLADQMNISEEDRTLLLPSGQQTFLSNRIGWARSYLKKAGLIAAPRRGYSAITDRGRDVLKHLPGQIDIAFLMHFPEFRQFKEGATETDAGSIAVDEEKTPQEYMEFGYKKIQEELEATLIEQIHNCSPSFFEMLVIDLLVAMGYGGSRREAGKITGKSGDEGIDGVINEDRLGLDVIYVQAKRWEGLVGRPEIQKFAGALLGKRAKKGIFITTSGFTKEAVTYSASIESKLVLIDGNQLAQLMIEHGVGVTTAQRYEIKKIDFDYFLEE